MARHLDSLRNTLRHHAKTGWQWTDAKLHPFPQNMGPAFNDYYASVKESQFWDTKKLLEKQNEDLASLIEHAYTHVPYYTRVMDERGLKPKDIQSKNDLSKLPFLTKQLIRENFDDLIATNSEKGKWIESHTSGSTGQPLTFLLDLDSSARELAFSMRAWSFGSYTPGDPIIMLRSFVPKPGEPMHYHDKRKNYHYLSAYHLTPEVMREYVKIINKSGATTLRGYPSSLYIFCHFLLQEGIILEKVDTAVTSSEILLPHYRETIRAALGGKPVLDWYGCNERVVTVSQCRESGQAYHTNSEYGIVEAVDDAGSVITEGTGAIVGTALKNRVMPLIRYRPNDFITIQKAAQCSCGRGLPLEILKIEGRSDEILAFGSLLIPSANFYTLFQTVPGVVQFQLIQNQENALHVLLVTDASYTDASRELIEKGLHNRIGKNIQLELEQVSEIARDPRTGKVKCVISNIARK